MITAKQQRKRKAKKPLKKNDLSSASEYLIQAGEIGEGI